MSTEPAAPRGPIFIIGAMGSGTTLLRLMLDSHEHIAIPHETGFMRAYMAHEFIPFKWTGANWAKRMGWSREELDGELSAFYDRIFMRYAEQQGKRRWGEKTPLHTWHIDGMARLWPDAQFVGIVRHPGASTASNMKRFHHTARKMAVHYRRYNGELLRQAAHHADRFVVLRYEDLVLRTEPVMRALLDWLGEPWSPAVLEHHVVQGAREQTRTEGKSRPDDPIDTSRITKWAETMERADRAVVKRRLDRIGSFMGYSVDDPAALAPLTGDDAPLLTGAQVGARIDEFADLDLRTQGEPPIFDLPYSPRKVWLVRNEAGVPPRSLLAQAEEGQAREAGAGARRLVPVALKRPLRKLQRRIAGRRA